MKGLRWPLLCVLVTVAGCAPMENIHATPEQQAWLEQIKAEPLTFEIPKADAADAWGRAQSFLGQYSTMKLQIATDYVLQTYNPPDADTAKGYNVTKTPLKDTVQITVQCSTGNIFETQAAVQDAHILAHYLKTGELPYPNLISR